MKKIIQLVMGLFVSTVLIVSCTEEKTTEVKTETGTPVKAEEEIVIPMDTPTFVADTFRVTESNAAFRNIEVRRPALNTYEIVGEARVFEATISWSLEDGHYYLDSGFVTADAGAPEWGNFSIPLQVDNKNPNTALLLLLFVHSAKDGTPTHELPIRIDKP